MYSFPSCTISVSIASLVVPAILDTITRFSPSRRFTIEDFVQGAQKLRRESPALRAYNTTIKSFSALTNQLVALLPEKEKKSAGDELMSFITKPAARSGK